MAGPTIEQQRINIREAKKKKIENNTDKKIKNMISVRKMFVRGIYFLYYRERVVYVGKSEDNIMQRVCDHYREGTKKFDSFFLMPYNVNNTLLGKIEKDYIQRLSPKYNKVYNNRKRNKRARIFYTPF